MFPTSPSQPPPPGVFVSEDQSEVTSPLSIAEWMLGFHAQAKAMSGCAEGICKEGEVLHVPSGWWHLVVNLSPSVRQFSESSLLVEDCFLSCETCLRNKLPDLPPVSLRSSSRRGNADLEMC